ncbi:MAG: hypothetical protein A3G96_01040 [Gammaproteobacteria bacterium RIFCSPLOWO2_12_FULL_52_10]|nr:MAG: hypothetical protein A3G96_01040 [Gammaproteobacteria bacterium RIFCSPLOWO2_12_FULL_52_10]
MSKISINQKVPAFNLPATGEKNIRLSAYKGKNIVLYFYPKDSTPGCTREGRDFRDNYRKFQARNTVVIGVSRDNLNSHEKFKTRENFLFDLIADTEETLCTMFAVMKWKNMYGKKVRGIERSTFLIDAMGILRNEWRKVSVDGHVEDVLATISKH